MYAWQFAKAQACAPTRFVSMQNHYNLVYREEEREMIPQCIDQGVGVSRGARWPAACWPATVPGRRTAHHPGADGRIRGCALPARDRLRGGRRAAEVAAQRGVPSAQVALSWLLHKPGVTAPIVGATKLEHLEDALGAEQLALSEAEIAALEEPYVPHAIAGHG